MSNRDMNQEIQAIRQELTILRRMLLSLSAEHEAIYRVTAFGWVMIAKTKISGWVGQKWARFAAWFKTAILRKGVAKA